MQTRKLQTVDVLARSRTLCAPARAAHDGGTLVEGGFTPCVAERKRADDDMALVLLRTALA
jgi:hypothetical protein